MDLVLAAAMCAHDETSAGVLCTALRNVCYNHEEEEEEKQQTSTTTTTTISNHAANKTRIGEAGGVALVLAAMRDHETNARVQEMACATLRNLAHSHAAACEADVPGADAGDGAPSTSTTSSGSSTPRYLA